MPHKYEKLVLAVLMFTVTQVGHVHANIAQPTPASMQSEEVAVHAAESALTDNDLMVVEGDILYRPALAQRGIGVNSGLAVWEDGVVPYYIDPALQGFVVQSVNTAIDTWNSVAGISLIEIDPGDLDSPTDYLHFTPANGCASWIGRQGGVQPVWTAPSCSSGSMMHEIGHALGLEHEHTRPDRDQFIKVNWQNINVDKTGNFNISNFSKQNYGPYDYASIMHYGEYFFSANGNPTISALRADNASIGQRVAPSAGDIEAITKLYASDVSLVSNSVSESGKSEVSLLVTNEYQQGANQIDIILNVGTAKLLEKNNDDWQCVAYSATLKCSKDRLSGGSQSSLVLLLDEQKSERDLNPSLVTKTPDENPSNNNGVFSPAAARIVFSDNAEQPTQIDDQLVASAGGVGLWMCGLFALLLGYRRRL